MVKSAIINNKTLCGFYSVLIEKEEVHIHEV